MKGIPITQQVEVNSNVFCIKDNWEIIRGRMQGNIGCQQINGASHRIVHIDDASHYGVVIADTPENYDHLVGIFGKERVPKPDMANETARAYLLKHGMAIGKVSDRSVEHARDSSQFFVVQLASDDGTFFVGNEAYSYCVLYNSVLQEIKPEPQRPALKAGDYVMGASDDLHDIEARKYKVFFDGEELVVFNDRDEALPILEQLDLGYFDRIEE